jgi:molybdopterin-guanine dinucleotide biosynthesis protein A
VLKPVPVVAASLAVSVVVVDAAFVVDADVVAVHAEVVAAAAAASVVEVVAVAAADGSDFYLIAAAAAAAAEQGDSAEADGNTVSSVPRALFVPSMVIFAVASNY